MNEKKHTIDTIPNFDKEIDISTFSDGGPFIFEEDSIEDILKRLDKEKYSERIKKLYNTDLDDLEFMF